MLHRSILFVCLGNICRSPLAEGAFRKKTAQAKVPDLSTIDSAGLGGWHAGDPPDPRAIRIAAENGFDISGQRARQIRTADFDCFDLILAMDRSNIEALAALCPVSGHGYGKSEIALFLDYTLGRADDVPDPYYGGEDGFRHAVSLIERASDALFEKLTA